MQIYKFAPNFATVQMEHSHIASWQPRANFRVNMMFCIVGNLSKDGQNIMFANTFAHTFAPCENYIFCTKFALHAKACANCCNSH